MKRVYKYPEQGCGLKYVHQSPGQLCLKTHYIGARMYIKCLVCHQISNIDFEFSHVFYGGCNRFWCFHPRVVLVNPNCIGVSTAFENHSDYVSILRDDDQLECVFHLRI